jgi:microcystin-dependent protein
MHRIDGAGHDNYTWVPEDPANNRPPTEITADIMNALQEEIANVIEAVEPLDKADNTQLRQAIAAMIAASPTLLPGAVMYFAQSTAPTGYLKANGAAISRTAYAALFAAIGTTFGAGDGATTFALPDLRDKFAIGADSLYALGATGGSKDAVVVSHTHTATVTDPGHDHTLKGQNATADGFGAEWSPASETKSGGVNAALTGISVSNSTTGVSGTNANLPPYLALVACIKY